MAISDSVRLLLLKIIHYNGNIEPLNEMGYEFSQIVDFIEREISLKNAAYENGKLKLTEKGLSVLESRNNKRKKDGSSKWIEPEIQSKISPLDKNDIFLPNQNDLWI
jgi:hypothetical protein